MATEKAIVIQQVGQVPVSSPAFFSLSPSFLRWYSPRGVCWCWCQMRCKPLFIQLRQRIMTHCVLWHWKSSLAVVKKAGPPLKYLDNCRMDYLEILYRNSWFPEDESCWLLWWSPDFPCSATSRLSSIQWNISTFTRWNEILVQTFTVPRRWMLIVLVMTWLYMYLYKHWMY